MKTRNPQAIDLGRRRRLAALGQRPKTPGAMLFKVLMQTPDAADLDGIHRNVRLTLATARALRDEALAGLWSESPPAERPTRRQS